MSSRPTIKMSKLWSNSKKCDITTVHFFLLFLEYWRGSIKMLCCRTKRICVNITRIGYHFRNAYTNSCWSLRICENFKYQVLMSLVQNTSNYNAKSVGNYHYSTLSKHTQVHESKHLLMANIQTWALLRILILSNLPLRSYNYGNEM